MRSRARLAAPALALTALLALTACGGERLPGGAAAVVDGESITVSEVTDLADGLSGAGEAQDPGARTEAQRQALTILVQGALFSGVAQAEGVAVPEGEVESEVEAIRSDPEQLQAAQAQGITPELLPLAVRQQLVQQAVASALGPDQVLPRLQEAAAAADVRVDPRLGELSLEDLSIQPAEPVLSTPATVEGG